MPDAVSGETSGNYKPHDHGLQPENFLQDHHSNSGHLRNVETDSLQISNNKWEQLNKQSKFLLIMIGGHTQNKKRIAKAAMTFLEAKELDPIILDGAELEKRRVAQAFHSLCDMYTPVVDKAVNTTSTFLVVKFGKRNATTLVICMYQGNTYLDIVNHYGVAKERLVACEHLQLRITHVPSQKMILSVWPIILSLLKYLMSKNCSFGIFPKLILMNLC
ncbi:hypothetical protein L9F63_009560, partial [Diploptera punctata]